MNVADSEEMIQHLSLRGFIPTSSPKDADLILVNTCTVRQHAEERALSYIGRLKKLKMKNEKFPPTADAPLAQKMVKPIIIVAGCVAERLRDSLQKRFPHVDLVIGAKDIEEFPKMLDLLLKERSMNPPHPHTTSLRYGYCFACLLPQGEKDHEEIPHQVGKNHQVNEPKSATTSLMDSTGSPQVSQATTETNKHGFDWFKESEEVFGDGNLRSTGEPFILGDNKSAFVTIMRGCNYSCSYCVVPSVRGREIYRHPNIILNEVRQKTKKGFCHITLLGQTVNSYWFKDAAKNGGKQIIDFSELLKMIHEVEDIEQINFMSPHPHHMNDKLIQTMAGLKKISRKLHLPIQSGSDRILKAMNRNYTREEYIKVIKKLRLALPDLQLSTDFIVGFPGETEEDFNQTLSLIEEVDFNSAYCFKYSERPGTKASQYPDDVPLEIKEKRLARLLVRFKKSQDYSVVS